MDLRKISNIEKFIDKRNLIKDKSKLVYLNQDIIDKEHWNEETIKIKLRD